jgi:hypothetical protein
MSDFKPLNIAAILVARYLRGKTDALFRLFDSGSLVTKPLESARVGQPAVEELRRRSRITRLPSRRRAF